MSARAQAALEAALTVHEDETDSVFNAVTNLLIDLEQICKVRRVNIKAAEWQADWYFTHAKHCRHDTLKLRAG